VVTLADKLRPHLVQLRNQVSIRAATRRREQEADARRMRELRAQCPTAEARLADGVFRRGPRQ
jgi:hypothetical protein